MEEDEDKNLFANNNDSALKNVDNINMKRSCRICLSQFDLGIPLFEPNETLNHTTAAALVWKCFGIKIYESDALPSQICNECAMNILISHNFKIQLQQSHKLLRTQFPHEQHAVDIFERPLRMTKIEENVYQIAFNNANEMETENEGDEVMKNYENLINNLKFEKKIKLKKDSDILLITMDKNKTENTKTSESQELEGHVNIPDIPKNIQEAYKWLKVAKQSGPPYSCKLCNRTYPSRYPTFYAHVRLHFATKVQCSLCPVKYLPSRKEYHMRKHTKEKPYTCSNCGKGFSMKNHLNRHLKFQCNTKEENACKKCQKVFPTYKLMHTHLVKDHGTCRHEQNKTECVTCSKGNENKNMCEYCGMKVTRYKRHLNTCAASPITTKFQLENATTCKKCGELFFSQYQLKTHMKKHEETKSCTCNVCGKIFKQNSYLKDHMEIHEPGKYPCDKCGKVFTRNLLLKLHKRIHTNVKKFECATCQKRCRTKADLNKHLVIHSKIKPFECKVCNKTFRLKGNLSQHLLVHMKVKYFSCSICSRTFAIEGNLKQHMLLHNHFSSG